MLALAATTLLAPALVGAATLVARRRGQRAGGIVSAFPAIVGPVLVIDLLERDAEFAARAATGTLLGLVALAVFVALYGRTAAAGGSWPRALLTAWAGAGVTGAVLASVTTSAAVAAVAASVALVAAARALGRTGPPTTVAAAAPTRGSLPARMAASAALVVALSAAAGAVGPTAGGVLAALPVLASVLAVATHRDDGPDAAAQLLRGMLGGMGGFVAFCLAVAVLLQPAGPVAAFAVATGGAVAAQLVAAAVPQRARPRTINARGEPRASEQSG